MALFLGEAIALTAGAVNAIAVRVVSKAPLNRKHAPQCVVGQFTWFDDLVNGQVVFRTGSEILAGGEAFVFS